MLYPLARLPLVAETDTFSRPLMCHVNGSVARIDLDNRTAVDTHSEHDPLKPFLYFFVDLVDGYADESGGKVGQKLLKVRCWLGGGPAPSCRGLVSELRVFSACSKRGAIEELGFLWMPQTLKMDWQLSQLVLYVRRT